MCTCFFSRSFDKKTEVNTSQYNNQSDLFSPNSLDTEPLDETSGWGGGGGGGGEDS